MHTQTNTTAHFVGMWCELLLEHPVCPRVSVCVCLCVWARVYVGRSWGGMSGNNKGQFHPNYHPDYHYIKEPFMAFINATTKQRWCLSPLLCLNPQMCAPKTRSAKTYFPSQKPIMDWKCVLCKYDTAKRQINLISLKCKMFFFSFFAY